MTPEEQKELDQYRRDHFAVKIESLKNYPWCEPGEKLLSVTHNGVQWQGINLTPVERLAVIKALLLE